MKTEPEDPKHFLDRHGITYREANGELIFACPFNSCDDDSRPNEAHLYMSGETGQYECKKCGEAGNLITLAKHFGNTMLARVSAPTNTRARKLAKALDEKTVDKYSDEMPDRIRTYLNVRGITDDAIAQYKLGYGEFYGRKWITIPVQNNSGGWFLKLRKDPEDQANQVRYMVYPAESEATLYHNVVLTEGTNMIVICGGELDCIVLNINGIPAVTSTAGESTFKPEWFGEFTHIDDLYICLDSDDPGRRAAEKLASKATERLPETTIYDIQLPARMVGGKDVTDYFTRYDGNPDELMLELPKHIAGPPPIDTSQFQPLSITDLVATLGLTIKKDEDNKVVTFLCQLAAYTENAQFNISFNAPSSTGKSFIPTEIARLFPASDVREIGYCSPTAFFHEVGEWDEARKLMIVDLSKKILIFLDQPHTQLLQHLRPLLSHDEKEITLKIADKTQKFGLRTKTVLLRGYPSVIFCTAGLNLDEQEATRFLLLSPEVDQVKIRAGIEATLWREADSAGFADWLNSDPNRRMLIERIRAIKREGITEVRLDNYPDIYDRFVQNRPHLKPRHQRDIKRLVALIKACALLNLWWRERDGTTITATQQDVDEGFHLWDRISVSQELNISPYLYNLYWDVIVAAWRTKNNSALVETEVGIGRQEIQQKHQEVHGKPINAVFLRQQVLPMLELAGLIAQEPDPADKRRVLVTPIILDRPENNSEHSGGESENDKDIV